MPDAVTATERPRRRRRGRPRELSVAARETAILDAAERLLVERGLQGASMAAIASAACMSKRTLYEVFDSRAALFEACIRRIRSAFARPLAEEERTLPLAERLERILSPAGYGSDPDVPITVLRTVITEAHRCPEIGEAFLREGPHQVRAVVRDELARAAGRSEIRCDDLDLAARMLCEMAFECPIDRLVDPGAAAPSPAQARRRVALAVRTFLAGFATSGTATKDMPAA